VKNHEYGSYDRDKSHRNPAHRIFYEQRKQPAGRWVAPAHGQARGKKGITTPRDYGRKQSGGAGVTPPG
jgi:hypothetical protein